MATAKQKRKETAASKKAAVELEQSALLQNEEDLGEDDNIAMEQTLGDRCNIERQGKELADLRLIIESLITKTQKIEESVASFERKVQRLILCRKEEGEFEDSTNLVPSGNAMLGEEAIGAQLLLKHDNIFIRNFNTEGSNLAVKLDLYLLVL